jgi:hypothetical protein
MKSAYVLIRNVFFSRIYNKAISVNFDSATKHRISEVSISQNSIQQSYAGGAIMVQNIGVNNASVWITGNNIMHNTAYSVDSIIHIINASLIMHSNLVYNNTGRYILELGTASFTNSLAHLIENNTFWLNAAQMASAEYTLAINAKYIKLLNNIFNNPASLFELSLVKGIEKHTSKLECHGNWWGSGRMDIAKRKIRDGRTVLSLPYVMFVPILESPPDFLGLSSESISKYFEKKLVSINHLAPN